jgi:hypothetical protein
LDLYKAKVLEEALGFVDFLVGVVHVCDPDKADLTIGGTVDELFCFPGYQTEKYEGVPGKRLI